MSDSDWIALFAVFISIFAFSISLYELLSNKPKLRIALGQAISTGPNFIYVEIINYGRQPTTIDSICFAKKGCSMNIWVPIYEPISSPKGAYLQPGEKATYYYDYDSKISSSTEEITLGPGVNKRLILAKVRDTWSGKVTTTILPNKKVEVTIQ